MQNLNSKCLINIPFTILLVTILWRSSDLQALEKFSVAGWSKPISEITNLLAEPDKGFFKAEGIKLVYVPGTGGGSAIANMLSGVADIAFTDPASFYQALDRGEKLIAIYNIYPQNVFNIVSLKSQNIKRPSDLKGKKIGVYSLSSGTRQNLQVLLHQVGLSEKDVTIQVTGLLNFAPVIQGQVHATAATDTGLFVGKLRGLKDINVIEIKNYLNIPSDIFVVTENTLIHKESDSSSSRRTRRRNPAINSGKEPSSRKSTGISGGLSRSRSAVSSAARATFPSNATKMTTESVCTRFGSSDRIQFSLMSFRATAVASTGATANRTTLNTAMR